MWIRTPDAGRPIKLDKNDKNEGTVVRKDKPLQAAMQASLGLEMCASYVERDEPPDDG